MPCHRGNCVVRLLLCNPHSPISLCRSAILCTPVDFVIRYRFARCIAFLPSLRAQRSASPSSPLHGSIHSCSCLYCAVQGVELCCRASRVAARQARLRRSPLSLRVVYLGVFLCRSPTSRTAELTLPLALPSVQSRLSHTPPTPPLLPR